MSNDLTFLNTYTEVVQENVSAIIKQNFAVDDLTAQNRELQTKVAELTHLTSSYRNVSDDKSRLQVSLNETSQVKNQLQSQINDLQQELTRLRAQSEELTTVKKENARLKSKYEPEEKTSVKKTEKTATKTPVAGTF